MKPVITSPVVINPLSSLLPDHYTPTSRNKGMCIFGGESFNLHFKIKNLLTYKQKTTTETNLPLTNTCKLIFIKDDLNMSKEKSFTATLSSGRGHLHFPRLTRGREVTIPIIGFFDFSPTDVFVSDSLFINSDQPKITLTFYFRHTGANFFSMYVVTPGPLFGREIGLNEEGNLTAMAGPKAGPKKKAAFKFADKNGRLLDLETHNSNVVPVQVTVNGHSITRSKNSSEGFILKTTMGVAIGFQLNILSRNVDWDVIGR
jgi:hypothetical protein